MVVSAREDQHKTLSYRVNRCTLGHYKMLWREKRTWRERRKGGKEVEVGGRKRKRQTVNRTVAECLAMFNSTQGDSRESQSRHHCPATCSTYWLLCVPLGVTEQQGNKRNHGQNPSHAQQVNITFSVQDDTKMRNFSFCPLAGIEMGQYWVWVMTKEVVCQE